MTTKLAEGWLATLDNQIDPTTGTIKLRANFDNANGSLFPNQFVNARLLVEDKQGVTLIPSACVQRNSQITYVYLIRVPAEAWTTAFQRYGEISPSAPRKGRTPKSPPAWRPEIPW